MHPCDPTLNTEPNDATLHAEPIDPTLRTEPILVREKRQAVAHKQTTLKLEHRERTLKLQSADKALHVLHTVRATMYRDDASTVGVICAIGRGSSPPVTKRSCDVGRGTIDPLPKLVLAVDPLDDTIDISGCLSLDSHLFCRPIVQPIPAFQHWLTRLFKPLHMSTEDEMLPRTNKSHCVKKRISNR